MTLEELTEKVKYLEQKVRTLGYRGNKETTEGLRFLLGAWDVSGDSGLLL